jgi:hypothetical protein
MTDPSAIVQQATDFLASCNYWAFISKATAVALGVEVSASGTLITIKKLPDQWHYALGALTAACLFAWTLLEPYEEYKQFRAAYAMVEHARLEYYRTGSDQELGGIIDAISNARFALKETWASPELKQSP